MVLPRTTAASSLGAGLLIILTWNITGILAATTCSTVIVSGAGDASGTYQREEEVIQPVYTRLAGSEVYSLAFNDNSGLWLIEPTVNADYPKYEVRRVQQCSSSSIINNSICHKV